MKRLPVLKSRTGLLRIWLLEIKIGQGAPATDAVRRAPAGGSCAGVAVTWLPEAGMLSTCKLEVRAPATVLVSTKATFFPSSDRTGEVRMRPLVIVFVL